MNRCEHFQELISQMIDGELSKEEKAELSGHLDTCEECAALYKVFENLSKSIQEDTVEAPESLCEDIMARLRREDIRKKNSVPWKKLLAAAACLAVILLAGASIIPSLPNRVSALTATPTIADSAAEESVIEDSAQSPALEFSAPVPSAIGNQNAQEAVQTTPAGTQENAAASSQSGTEDKTGSKASNDNAPATTSESDTVDIIIPADSPKAASNPEAVPVPVPAAADSPEAVPVPEAADSPEAMPVPAAMDVPEAMPVPEVIESYSLTSVAPEERAFMLAAEPPISVEMENYKRWTQLTVLLDGKEVKAEDKDNAESKDTVENTDKDEFEFNELSADEIYEVVCLNRKDLKMSVFVFGEKLYYRFETVEEDDTAADGKALTANQESGAAVDALEDEEEEVPLFLAKCKLADFVKFIEAK